MEVTPTNPSLAIQSALQLIATGTYSDNSTGDFTHSATWSSSDTTKATVSSSGLVTGIAAGTATITATSGDKSGSTTVTVSTVEPLMLPRVAEILAVPTATAVASPFEPAALETVATAGVSEAQVTWVVRSWVEVSE